MVKIKLMFCIFGPGGLCAPPEVAFAMCRWPLLLPTFALFFFLSFCLSFTSFAFDPLWGNSRGWNLVSPNILAQLADFYKTLITFICFLHSIPLAHVYMFTFCIHLSETDGVGFCFPLESERMSPTKILTRWVLFCLCLYLNQYHAQLIASLYNQMLILVPLHHY